MSLLAAICTAGAVLSLSMILLRPASMPRFGRRLVESRLEREERRLNQARIQASPVASLALALVSPAALFILGWIISPGIAIVLGLGGLLLPRMYLSYLIHAQTRQSESHAPRLLHSLLASLSAGSTYLEALRQAQATISDRWIREDLGLVIQKFLLDSPLESGLREVRKRVHSRNLGIIWDSLAVCCANRVPPRVAHSLLSEVASTVQFNVELASEVEARSAGQRTQVLLLAVIVPGLYLYLRWLSPDLLDGLDQSALGRYFLLPAAALLEAAGLYLSFRFSRVAP